MADYRRIADRVADDIASGRLRPGQQLPPQRVFARRRGIAGSTAGRVYAELVRRGLVVGEVGRGTFVRAAAAAPNGRALIEAATTARVNLELNYPSAPGQSELLAPALAPLLRPDVLTEALHPAPATGTAAAREATAAVLAGAGGSDVSGGFAGSGGFGTSVGPAVSVGLTEPGGSAEAGGSATPVGFTGPGGSAEAGGITEPGGFAASGGPAISGGLTEAGGFTRPGGPATPVGFTEPGGFATSGGPAISVGSADAGGSTGPGGSAAPGAPAAPGTPGAPATPGVPRVPGTPSASGAPAVPSMPATPRVPATSRVPAAPATLTPLVPATRPPATLTRLVPATWPPAPHRILFTGNARQGIAAALASLVRPGGRVGVEPLTYPLVKEIAVRLGITLVALEVDDEGLCPESVAVAHRSAPLSALYLQPTLHNPTSVTTSAARRVDIAGVVTELGLAVVEDRIWAFLRPDSPAPLAAHAPGLVHVVDGLSKRVAPGLTVGFLVVPEERVEAVAAAIRSGGWSAGRFALEAGVRWMADGTVERLVAAKRVDAAGRQRIVAEELDGFAVRSDPLAYYAWWELPAPWRADTFTAAAAAHGIAVTPGTAFAVDPKRTPDAVRLGLASAAVPDLRRALRTLAGLAGGAAAGTPVPGGRTG